MDSEGDNKRHGLGLAKPATLLLTGASGLVGGELLRRFVAQASPPRLLALHRQGRPGGPAEAVAGDLRLPGLGIPPEACRRLQQEVTDIIHCAADTRFGLELEAAREVNTRGTARVLEFAGGCTRLQRLAHLSTVYVAGDRTGAIAEEFGPPPARFFNTYQQSKYEAEDLVNRAAGELPVMVIRLSSLAGDSASGLVRRFNYVHQLLRLLPRNVLPVAPGDLDAPMDLIPTDYAADAVFHIFTRRFRPGITCQVCAGPEQSLSLRDLLRLTLDALERPVPLPKFVALPEYERWAEEQAGRGSALLRQVLAAVGHFLPHLALRQEFQNQNARAALEGSRLSLPAVSDYFPKVVRYCLASSRS